MVFLVIVEIHHLAQKLIRNFVNRSDLEGRNRYIAHFYSSDDRGELLVVYPIYRFNDFQIILRGLIFVDGLLRRCKMLLVG